MNPAVVTDAEAATLPLSLATLRQQYQSGDLAPAEVLARIRRRARAFEAYNIWIHLLSEAEQAPYLAALEGKPVDSLPLYGVPFAIKDNIDLAGIPTTAACEAFAYLPEQSAFVVRKLLDAGAIPVGKTNLDQFATGLNGTRSPWGACRNAFDPEMISGGSSSGSAVAVALGLASFALGTDTAGSGRVPVCFNNLVGVKPTLGLVSSSGVVPACRSLDCISLMTLNTDDAAAVLAIAEGEDRADPYSRRNPFHNNPRHYGRWSAKPRLGIPAASQLNFFGHKDYEDAYAQSLAALRNADFELVAIDLRPFLEAARVLYEGPWVAERYITVSPLLQSNPGALLDVTRSIIAAGARISAEDTFKAQYHLKALRREAQDVLEGVDCLLTPTAGRPFRIAELQADPVTLNSHLGYYTNYMNLFDMSAVAVPTAFTAAGFPFGLTLAGEAFNDRMLLSIANRMQQVLGLPLGNRVENYRPPSAAPVIPQKDIAVVVCGAHLEGQPLNWQLTERGARLVRKTRSAPDYQLYALAGGPPLRPGMVVAPEGSGSAIDVEVWAVPAAEFGSFVAGIPAPLGIGKVRLEDGAQVPGFICESSGLQGAREITAFGGWRQYLQSLSRSS